MLRWLKFHTHSWRKHVILIDYKCTGGGGGCEFLMQILDFVLVPVSNNIYMFKLDVPSMYLTLNPFLKQEKVVFGSSTTSLLQKLLKKPPSSRFVAALQTPNPIIPLNQEHNLPTDTLPTNPILTHQFVGSSSSTLIFPSFPFGFASKPVFENGFLNHVSEDAELEDAQTLWADSVKKKRKKKMNKHKYQKLRKRMRRQT